MGLKGAEGLREFCEGLSADSPSPGGGSASAAGGAMGASLLIMVCGLALKKKDTASKEELKGLKERLVGVRDRLIALSQEDAQSFDQVMMAFRMRREGPGEESDRAVQNAIKHAADVPLETVQYCLEALELSQRVADLGLKSTSSDLAVGVLLAEAGLRGASRNVRINLKDIEDGAYVKATSEKLESHVRRGDAAFKLALSKVDGRLL